MTLKALGIIHQILPRFSMIKRQAIGQFGEIQIIATNIDYGFIVQAVDRNFNINILERYLTICNSSKVSPVILIDNPGMREVGIADSTGGLETTFENCLLDHSSFFQMKLYYDYKQEYTMLYFYPNALLWLSICSKNIETE